MSNQMTFRILREIHDIQKSPESCFQLWYNEEDVTCIEAMITGSPDTPYGYGMFTFKFNFPATYPNDAPKVVITTTNQGRTRFNPNLYNNGKVCLSIIGTWQARHPSEVWNSAHGILSVLISIQSLMGENPYTNEPGHENPGPGEEKNVEAYKRKITHETIRISVIDRIEKCLDGHLNADRKFEDVSKYLFMCYYRQYLKTIETESAKVGVNERFVKMRFEGGGNTMDGEFNYPDLTERLHKLFKRVSDETQSWVDLSKTPEWSGADCLTFHNLTGQFTQITQSKDFDGQMDLELEEAGNPYVWVATVFGRPSTNYEGGMFRVRLVFHKDFPALRPRVTFVTPFYHPNVSQDGIPWYRAQRMDDVKTHLAAILSLFTDDPSTDPTTHLNPEAARLCFADKDGRREFGRNARRCADRSVEYM
ncbi:ubiquitin-conjugating enzyme/RWD-like protein, partial [Catenaria anguillulae PL171]